MTDPQEKREEVEDDVDQEIDAEWEPLPDGWTSIGPNWILRIDGMRITTPNPALWGLDLLGNCPFVAETTRTTKWGPQRVQRPLLSNQLVQACEEADERFPVPAWLIETDDGKPQRLDTDNTDNQDNGWLVIRRHARPGVVVEGIEIEEMDAAPGFDYIAGSRPWSPSAFRMEKDRAAQRRALTGLEPHRRVR